MDDARSRGHDLQWLTWRQGTDAVAARIAAEVTAATGLSEADHGVLARLADLGGGSLRQADLTRSLGWSRPRMSTHLTRMESRGLLSRATQQAAVLVTITQEGRQALERARPVHEAAVRRHLTDPLDTAQLAVLDVALTRWNPRAPQG